MQKIWEAIKNYYTTLGNNYHVDPVIFLGIHVIATPLFVLSVAWLVKNARQKKSIILPTTVSIFIFNAANIYLIFFGQNIPWYIFAFVGVTTIISGYFSYKKIKEKIKRPE